MECASLWVMGFSRSASVYLQPVMILQKFCICVIDAVLIVTILWAAVQSLLCCPPLRVSLSCSDLHVKIGVMLLLAVVWKEITSPINISVSLSSH